MSQTSKRLQTLRALTTVALYRTGSSVFTHVDHELQEMGTSVRVSPQRRSHLLQVFHGIRALETALLEVAKSHGLTPTMSSLGAALYCFAAVPPTHPAHLGARDKSRFIGTVTKVRNTTMHQANVFPRSSREAEVTLGEIATCFSLLVR